MCGRFPCIISDILGIARIEQDILGCVGIDQDGWEVYSNINNIPREGVYSVLIRWVCTQ